MSASPRYIVELTDSAEADLEDIYDYLIAKDAADAAEKLLARLLEKAARLKEFPERGSVPKELLALGVDDHRQLVMPPYRLIYRVDQNVVTVVLIADGRRDMEALLRDRLYAP